MRASPCATVVWISLLGGLLAGCAMAPAMRLGPGPGESQLYRVREKATLHDVAHFYGYGYVEVVAANPGVDPWIPGRGTRIALPDRQLPPDAEHDGIVINLADMRLYFFAADQGSRSYPIGIGRDGLSTPLGRTTVVRKEEHPTWRPTPRMRRDSPELPAEVPAGPDNPMGTRALYLGFRPYAIHGTNKPLGVGRRVSSGCIRMYPNDIEDLFARVEVGTKVTIVNQPIKFAWIHEELFMQVHPTLDQAIAVEAGKPIRSEMTDAIARQVRAWAKNDAERVDWELVRKLVEQRRGIAAQITRPG
jgi:L,D-transpeptidase ErfK/SrfK